MMRALKQCRDKEVRTKLQREIAKQLRTMYEPIAKGELPARLEELVQRLEEARH